MSSIFLAANPVPLYKDRTYIVTGCQHEVGVVVFIGMLVVAEVLAGR